jgi:hypothetical protein
MDLPEQENGMAKRFRDTEIWSEDWYISLESKYMLFWDYICDKCDYAGIIRPNKTLFEKVTGLKIDLDEFIQSVNTDKVRVEILGNGKWFLTGFIPFQYGAVLRNSNMHKNIIRQLENNEVLYKSYTYSFRVDLGCDQGGDTQEEESFPSTENPENNEEKNNLSNKSNTYEPWVGEGCSQGGSSLKDKDKEKDIDYSFNLKNKEKSIKEVSIVPSPVDELFQYWLSHKNMIQHKELSDKVKAKIKATFKEESFENLKAAIDNYSTILATPGYFYTYRHSMEDFFRAGANKISPYKRFLPEMNPLENLKKNKNFNSSYTQHTQEEPEVDSRVEQERFTEDRALNRLSEAVRRFKSARGEDPKKWVDFFCFARPADRDNAFLRWIWDMAIKGIPFTEEIFNQIHNRIKESGLTIDTWEKNRDEIFNRFAATSAQQRT